MKTFFPGDRAPRAGDIWGSLAHAQTLREIALTGTESFYRGAIATAIANFAERTGGLLTLNDMARHESLWVEPLVCDYRGHQIWELPPNTQGIAALIALNILDGFDGDSNSAEGIHRAIEAMKLAIADTRACVADPDFAIAPADLLDRDYARCCRDAIGSRARACDRPNLPRGGTVYLATADERFMVSFIQSNFAGFGSGILVPSTGIALQNRATGFCLDRGHPNCLAPAKRPFHTIIPGFIGRDNRGIAPFGVMGGPMQPQGHLQVIRHLIDGKLNPQAALDAPRWRFIDGNRVWLEADFDGAIAEELKARGHAIDIAPAWEFGKGQMIYRQGETLVAATDPRADGLALAY